MMWTKCFSTSLMLQPIYTVTHVVVTPPSQHWAPDMTPFPEVTSQYTSLISSACCVPCIIYAIYLVVISYSWLLSFSNSSISIYVGYSITTPFRNNLERHCEGKLSQRTEVWTVYMVVRFVWKEKCPDVQFTDWWSVASGLMDCQALERAGLWKIRENDLVKDVDRSFQMGKGDKDTCIPM